MTIGEARRIFLNHCRIAKGLSANTLKAYAQDLAEYAGFAGSGMDLGACGRDHIRDYLCFLQDGRSLKAASVKRRIACLKVMYRWLENEEVIAISPFHRLDVTIRLPKRLPRTLSGGEMRRLFRALHVPLPATGGIAPPPLPPRAFNRLTIWLAVELMFATGMRVGELVAILPADIDLAEGTIRIVGKGNRERRVFLVNKGAKGLVGAYIEARRAFNPAARALLLNSRGAPASAQFVRLRLRAYAEEAGIGRRVTPHMLRHTAATRLLEAGVDIRYVQKLLGHQNITTTEIYTEVTDKSLKKVISQADTRKRLGGEMYG